MRYNYMLPIILTISSALAAGNQPAEEAGSEQLVANDKTTQILQKYTQEDSEVVQVKKACEADHPDADEKTIVDCIWSDGRLSEAKRKEIYKALNFGKEENTYAPTISNFKRKDSAAVKKLEQYMEKRLSEALADTTTKNNVGAVTDQTIFLKIYKTQLGKNLITEIAGYCIYSDPNTGFVPEGNRKELEFYHQKNIENLNQKGIINTSTQEEGSIAYNGFAKCMGRIGSKCRGDDTDPGLNTSDNRDPDKRIYVPSDATAPASIKMISSCELNRLITGVKDAITKTDDILETYKNMKPSASLQILNPNTKNIDVNKIVNVGSKELVEKSGYAAELKKMKNELSTKCSTQDAAKIPECKKYFSDEETNKKLALEYDFRNKALAQKLSDDLDAANGDMEKLKKIYKDQGLSDADFKELLQKVPANQNAFEYLKDKIKKQYNNERTQLTASLNAKLKETQIKKDDPSTATSVTSGLIANYDTSAQGLAQVYQYANIVSSFIEVNSDGQKMKNTAALSAELNSNYFSADSTSGRSVAGTNPTTPPVTRNFDNLKAFDRGTDSSGGQNVSETSIGVEDLNRIQWLKGQQAPTATPSN